MATGWTNNRRCPICDGSGWGKSRCRGFLHSDGSAVFCEHPDRFIEQHPVTMFWEKTDTSIAPFGISLWCFREKLEA